MGPLPWYFVKSLNPVQTLKPQFASDCFNEFQEIAKIVFHGHLYQKEF